MSLPAERRETANSHSRYSWAAAALPKGCKVADVGCGLGFGLQILQHRHAVVGIDVTREAIERATVEHKGLYILANAEIQTFRGFDAVVCLESLSHFIDPYAWLKGLEVQHLVISAPTTPSKRIYPWRKHDIPESDLRQMIEPRWMIVDEFRQVSTPEEQYLTLYARRPD